MINRWTHDPKDNKRKRIDYRKTALAKEKLIAEGKNLMIKKKLKYINFVDLNMMEFHMLSIKKMLVFII